MPYSYQQYTGNGSTKVFNIGFGYIFREHIEVRVSGVLKTVDVDYTFTGDNIVNFTTAPPAGAIVEIRRNTPKGSRIVDFVTGAALSAEDLDRDSTQLLYITQEGLDAAADATAVAPEVRHLTFNGEAQLVVAQSGIATVERLNTGHYRVHFSTIEPDTNYTAVASGSLQLGLVSVSEKTTSGLTLKVTEASSFMPVDDPSVNLIVTR